MNQSMSKFLVASGIIAVILVITIIGWVSNRRSPTFLTGYESPDTGEVIQQLPNVTPEKASSGVILLGSYLLFDNGSTQAQFEKIREALGNYSRINLQNKYSSLTLLPTSFVAGGEVLKAKMRLGDSDNIVDFKARLWQLRFIQIEIKDPSGDKNGGDYNSGQLEIDD